MWGRNGNRLKRYHRISIHACMEMDMFLYKCINMCLNKVHFILTHIKTKFGTLRYIIKISQLRCNIWR